MKIEVVYVAYDGEKFSSPAECKEYENHAISLLNEFNSHVLLLDIMKRPIFCRKSFNIEDMITWLHNAFSDCSYVHINTELSNDLITFINDYLRFIFPQNKVGLYKYDYYDNEWVSTD